MSRKLAYEAKITNLEPIKGKDRIELATINEGFEVIVQKGEHNVGDFVIYCEYDTILPVRPEFEFLRSRCYNSKYDGFRIKSMKMSGVFSQGIVFPLSIAVGKLRTDGDATEVLGVRKYDPELLKEMKNHHQKKRGKFNSFMFKFNWYNKLYFYLYKLFTGKTKGSSYPDDISKSDETNIQNIFVKLKEKYPDELYYLTEKMEGQAITMEYRHKSKSKWWKFWDKPRFNVYSHNIRKNVEYESTWWRVAKSTDMKNKLSRLDDDYSIQGEVCSPGVQKNIYKFLEPKLFVYRVKNLTTGKYLQYPELIEFCWEVTLNVCPLIESNRKLPESVREILDESNGVTFFNNEAKQLREGIVWRSMRDQTIGFKAKSPKYIQWFEKNSK